MRYRKIIGGRFGAGTVCAKAGAIRANGEIGMHSLRTGLVAVKRGSR